MHGCEFPGCHVGCAGERCERVCEERSRSFAALRMTSSKGGTKEASKKQGERRDIDRSSTRWAWKSGYPGEVQTPRAVEAGTRFRNRAARKTATRRRCRFGAIENDFSRLPTGTVERRRESRGGDVGLASTDARMLAKFGAGFRQKLLVGRKCRVQGLGPRAKKAVRG